MPPQLLLTAERLSRERLEPVLNRFKTRAGPGGTKRESGRHRDESQLSGQSLSRGSPSDGRTRAGAGREGRDLPETWL